MLKQILIVFFVFLAFVVMGGVIFIVTKDVEWFLPFEDAHGLKGAPQEAWPFTRAEDGSFSIRMPTLAQYVVENVAVSEDRAVRYEIYTAFGYSGQQYIVGIARLPQTLDLSDPRSILNAEQQNLLAEYPPSALKDYQTIVLEGYPGIDFRIDPGNENVIACRFVLIERSLYQFMLQIKGNQNFPEEDFQFFLRSFQLSDISTD